jgi:hypothetical protein
MGKNSFLSQPNLVFYFPTTKQKNFLKTSANVLYNRRYRNVTVLIYLQAQKNIYLVGQSRLIGNPNNTHLIRGAFENSKTSRDSYFDLYLVIFAKIIPSCGPVPLIF